MKKHALNAPIPPFNRTLLHSAVIAADPDLTWRLLINEANPFARDYQGSTAIDFVNRILESETTQDTLTKLRKIQAMLPKNSYPDAPTIEIPVLTDSDRSKSLNNRVSDSSLETLPPPPKLTLTQSTPVHGSRPLNHPQRRQLSQDDLVGHRIGRSTLLMGTQVLNSKMLDRLIEGDGNETPPPPPIQSSDGGREAEGETEGSQPIDTLKKDPEVRVQSKEELIENIIGELEFILSVQADADEDKDKRGERPEILPCTSCYDDVTTNPLLVKEGLSLAYYACPLSQCGAALCAECLYSLVDVSISNALYAVPRIRCPGMVDVLYVCMYVGMYVCMYVCMYAYTKQV
jgi:hypothetical protein